MSVHCIDYTKLRKIHFLMNGDNPTYKIGIVNRKKSTFTFMFKTRLLLAKPFQFSAVFLNYSCKTCR